MGAPIPDDPIYLRILGGIITGFGVAYWYASRDPLSNVAILRAGVVDNGLTALVTLYFIIFKHSDSSFLLVTAVLTSLFFIALLVLMPWKRVVKS